MTFKKSFYSISFAVSILFAVLFPSVHAMEHFQKESTVEKCVHKHNNTHEITHEHSHFHDCFVCGFNLNLVDFKVNNFNSFTLFENYFTHTSGSPTFFVTFFKGSHFFLRGPPLD